MSKPPANPAVPPVASLLGGGCRRPLGAEISTLPKLALVDDSRAALTVRQDKLALIDLISEKQRKEDPTLLEQLLMRKGHVELRVRREPSHGRPNFQIAFKNQHKASYALDDFSCLAGNIPKKDQDEMLDWAKQNQAALLQQWDSLNEEERITCEVAGT